MAFWLVCLGILAYSCQNTSRDTTYWIVTINVAVKREVTVNPSAYKFPEHKKVAISFSKVRYNCRYTISCLRRKNIKMLFDLLEFCFLRKLITNFFSRFPGLQIIVLPNLLTYPLYAMVSYDNTPCLQWPDRSGLSPDSLLSPQSQLFPWGTEKLCHM